MKDLTKLYREEMRREEERKKREEAGEKKFEKHEKPGFAKPEKKLIPERRKEGFDDEIEGKEVILVLTTGVQYQGRVYGSKYWYKIFAQGKLRLVNKAYIIEVIVP